MGEFFRGWKTRIGCITLMIGCVFMAGWVRTFSQRDLVGIKFSSQSSVFVESAEQTIGFGMERANKTPIWDIFPTWQTSPSSGVKPLDNNRHVKWSLQWRDFGIGGNYQDYPDYLLLEVHAPYWLITIPLTALSAYLLLTKSRPSTLKKIVASTANEEA